MCRVPLTSILLIFELTRNYNAILPVCGAVGISYFISTQGEKLVDRFFASRGGAVGSPTPAPPVPLSANAALALRSPLALTFAGMNRASPADWQDVLAAVERVGAGGKPVTDVTTPGVLLLDDQLDLESALRAMEAQGAALAVAVSREGEYRGVVCLGDVRQSMAVLMAARTEDRSQTVVTREVEGARASSK